jgi:hypothetical protein
MLFFVVGVDGLLAEQAVATLTMSFRFSLALGSSHASRLTVMGEILPFSLAKCCFRFDLIIGCAVYVTVEVYLWAILMLTSIYSEFKMAQNNEILAFRNFTKSSSYYVTAFGSPAEGLARAVIGELNTKTQFAPLVACSHE